MTNYLKQWWDNFKANYKRDNIARLKDSFYLKEKNSHIWIMHDGVAINQLPPFASTDEIVVILEETRTCAIEHAYGKEEK